MHAPHHHTDVVRTTLTRFESSMYNNTLRCDMQLDLMGACLDELVLEVYSGAYVTIKVWCDVGVKHQQQQRANNNNNNTSILPNHSLLWKQQ